MPAFARKTHERVNDHINTVFARASKYMLERRVAPYVSTETHPRNLLWSKLWQAQRFLYKDILPYLPTYSPLWVPVREDSEIVKRRAVDPIFAELPMREVFDTTRACEVVVSNPDHSIAYLLHLTHMPMNLLPMSTLCIEDMDLFHYCAQASQLFHHILVAKHQIDQVLNTYNLTSTLGLLPHLAAEAQKYKRLPKRYAPPHRSGMSRLDQKRCMASSQLYGEAALSLTNDPNWMTVPQCTTRVYGPILIADLTAKEEWNDVKGAGWYQGPAVVMKQLRKFRDIMHTNGLPCVSDRCTLNKEVLDIFTKEQMKAHGNIDISVLRTCTSNRAVAEIRYFM